MKKGKLVKRILLSVLAVILIVIIVAVLYVKIAILPEIQEYMNDPELVALLEELQQEATDNAQNPPDNTTDTPDPEVDGAVIWPTVPPELDVPDNTPTLAPNKNTGNRIEELAKDLPPADVAAATALAAKVDPGYILGLLKGGLTIEEKRELVAYLQARLSKEEIRKGVALYNKYSYLLSS